MLDLPPPLIYLAIFVIVSLIYGVGWISGHCANAEMLRKSQEATRAANIRARVAEQNSEYHAQRADCAESLLDDRESLLPRSLIDNNIAFRM